MYLVFGALTFFQRSDFWVSYITQHWTLTKIAYKDKEQFERRKDPVGSPGLFFFFKQKQKNLGKKLKKKSEERAFPAIGIYWCHKAQLKGPGEEGETLWQTPFEVEFQPEEIRGRFLFSYSGT